MSASIKSRNGGYATFANRWVDAGYMAQATGSVTKVYFFLARWADNNSQESIQPMPTIAKKCGITEDVARKAVRTLEAWGVITLEPEPGPRGINVWTINELDKWAPTYPGTSTTPTSRGGSENGGGKKSGPYQPEDVYQPEDYNNQPEDSHQETPKPNTLSPSKFDAAWSLYPRKVGKGDAKKAWAKINPTDDLFERIMQAISEQKESQAWTKEKGRFIPHFATWLNGERWEDEVDNSGPREKKRSSVPGLI